MVFLNFLPWLLQGKNRLEYKALEQHEIYALSSSFQTDLFSLCLVSIIISRLLFNSLFYKATDDIAKHRGSHHHHRDGSKLREELWVLFGNMATLSFCFWIMMHRNGHCTFTTPQPCLEGWPNHSINPLVKLYFNLELAWYVHLLLKNFLRYGAADGRDMVAHHAISIALLVFSWGFNLTRCAILILSLFSLSNPALHFAKICNQLNIPYLRIPAFAFFSLIFFLSRVLMGPFILFFTTIVSRELIPYAIEDFFPLYILLNSLLLVLYCMQVIWMQAIYRVLKEAVTTGAHAASVLSAQVDPAKRYQYKP